MLLALMILLCLFCETPAHFTNKTDLVLHTIRKRDTYGKNLCQGMTVKQCSIYEPEELKKCNVCGLINTQIGKTSNGDSTLVIKGDVVKPSYKYPWMVALTKNSLKICGGAIITESLILTAGHCVTQYGVDGNFQRYYRPDDLEVVFLTKTRKVEPGPPIEKILRHPLFDPVEVKYDVALVKLSKKITCGVFKNPICLPVSLQNFRSSDASHITFEITGWGAISVHPIKYSNKLKEGKVRMVNFSKCKPHLAIEIESAYCLKGVEQQRPCFGDSGGSLFFNHHNRYVSMGVASLHTCKECGAGRPFLYSSIPKVLPWIQNVIRSHKRN